MHIFININVTQKYIFKILYQRKLHEMFQYTHGNLFEINISRK